MDTAVSEIVVDLTPKWEGIVLYLAEMYAGNGGTSEPRTFARNELLRLARYVDGLNSNEGDDRT